ncbi:hypothetical protein K438DRAFT_1997744 [Mycena galopus ATCC 62051]|nr:hypothetical protein K438DRAFT_1997744 [Mycena galopus ATCC 62051]
MPIGIKKWGHGERENLRPKQAVRGESVPGAALCTVAALLHDSGTLGQVVQDICYLRAPSPVNVSHALSEGTSPPSECSQRGSQAPRPLLRPRTKILCAASVRAEHVHAIVASCRGYGGTKWGAQLLSAPIPLPRVDATLAAAAFNPRASVLRPRGCRSLHSARTTLHPTSHLEPPCLSDSLRSTTAFVRFSRGTGSHAARCAQKLRRVRVGGAASPLCPRLDGKVYHTNVRRKVSRTPPFLCPTDDKRMRGFPCPCVHRRPPHGTRAAPTALVPLAAAACALVCGQALSVRRTSAPLVATFAAHFYKKLGHTENHTIHP